MNNLIFVTVATVTMFGMWASHSAGADSEEAGVRQVIVGVADAATAFPCTKDHDSVLRFFAKDFSSIDDVEQGSIQNLEHTLRQLERDLADDALTITDRVSDIVVHVVGSIAWSTYKEKLTIVHRDGTAEDESLCTAIFIKTDTRWLYQHEHCSSYPTMPATDLQDSSQLTRIESHLSQGVSGRLLQKGE